MELRSAENPVKQRHFWLGSPLSKLTYHHSETHIHIYKLYKFHESRYNNYSTINDTIQAKGAVYFATLQGYIIFETDLYLHNSQDACK